MEDDFHHKTIHGLEFKSGSGAQERMFKMADEEGHRVYIASDFAYQKNGKKTLTKAYRSFPNWDSFFESYYPRHMNEWYLYEIIRENQPCRPYFDLDWSLEDWSVAEVMDEFADWLSKFGVKIEDMATMDGSEGKRGSLHVILFPWVVPSNEKMRDWVKKEMAGSEIISGVVDWKIYTKNRLMRLPYSRKMKEEGEDKRMLCPRGHPGVMNLLITHLNGDEKEFPLG